jgi:hypothetical protein
LSKRKMQTTMSNIGWSCLHITITEISDLNFTEPVIIVYNYLTE